jgi:hypothetical protein
MSSPLRSGVTAFFASVYVAATAGVFFWGVDLAVVSGVENLFETLSLIPSTWLTIVNKWDVFIALGLAFPMAGYLGLLMYRRAYATELEMSDV